MRISPLCVLLVVGPLLPVHIQTIPPTLSPAVGNPGCVGGRLAICQGCGVGMKVVTGGPRAVSFKGASRSEPGSL